jgi:hypothetical protein
MSYLIKDVTDNTYLQRIEGFCVRCTKKEIAKVYLTSIAAIRDLEYVRQTGLISSRQHEKNENTTYIIEPQNEQ